MNHDPTASGPPPPAIGPDAPGSDVAGQGASRWRRRALIGLALLVAIALIAQPVRLRAVAAATVADALDLDIPRPFAHDPHRRATHLEGIEVDVYGPSERTDSPDGPLPGIAADAGVLLLVPGAAPDGRDDRRLVALAEAFARSGQVVVVPELEVYQEDLVPEDLDRLVTLVGVLAPVHGPVVLAGISFGGSLSLVAAGDARIDGDVALVATFGAYADLGGVVQAAVTGVGIVDGERYPWDPDPRAPDVVREQVVGLLPDADGQQLAAALEARDASTLPAGLLPAYELLTADDPTQVPSLVDALPAPVRDRLDVVSPIRAVPELDVPIVALHARDDPVIPYAELHRLGSHYPHARLLDLATFDHVGIDPDREISWWVTVRDLWATTRFVTEVLAARS